MEKLFKKLKLKKELVANLTDIGFVEMTPIQSQSLPILLAGKDIIAQAKTGSGKTAAFGLSILNNIDVLDFNIQSLVLCPTRELADQVASEIRRLARRLKNLKVTTITGGTSEYHQEKSLSHGAHIIVGTPGRVLRLLKKKTMNFNNVSMLVFDEADRMLDMGFVDDIMAIESFIPKKRHTMLFSATYPQSIVEMSENVLSEPEMVKIDVDHDESVIREILIKLESHKLKNDAVLKIIKNFPSERIIIFCKTKQITDTLADFLYAKGLYASSIHGDIEQNERTSVLEQFSNNSLSILVATDVAARGIDIKDLPMVINYDLPIDAEIYTHRIGRTGRAGAAGLAFSLFVEQEEHKVEEIQSIKNRECEYLNYADLSDEKTIDLTPPMRTIYISGGKKDKLRPGDIVGAIIGETGLSASEIGNISILPIVSYVAIKREDVNMVVDKLSNGKIKNRRFRVGIV